MGEIFNLRLARKAKERSEKATRAGENRLKFGTTKSKRERAALESKLSESKLDGHKLTGNHLPKKPGVE